MKKWALVCGIIVFVYSIYPWLLSPSNFLSMGFPTIIRLVPSFALLFVCVQLFTAMRELNNVGKPIPKAVVIRDLEDQVSKAKEATAQMRLRCDEEVSNARQEAKKAQSETNDLKYSLVKREDEAKTVERQINELKATVNKIIMSNGGKGSMKVKGYVGGLEVSIAAEFDRVVEHSPIGWNET